MPQNDWNTIIKKVLGMDPGTNIFLRREDIAPIPQCFFLAVGEQKGQLADWELPLENGGRIHVIEYPDYFLVHWDRVSPRRNPLKHLRVDAPHWYDLMIELLKVLRK